MKKQEILAKNRADLIKSMEDVYTFLQKKYQYEGQVLTYTEKLTEHQQQLLRLDGWKVEQKNNNDEDYFTSWIEIS